MQEGDRLCPVSGLISFLQLSFVFPVVAATHLRDYALVSKSQMTTIIISITTGKNHIWIPHRP